MGNLIRKLSPHNEAGIEVGKNVDRQAAAGEEMYQLVKPPNDAIGQDRGILVKATADAFNNKKNYDELRELIRKHLDGYLYNNGDGQEVEVRELVMARHNEREKRIERQKQQAGSSATEDHSDTNFQYIGNQTRKCCWDVNKRGAVGETILHLCFLNDTKVHRILAKHLIAMYPNLLHDIYHSEEYYGEAVLHMALANEDMELLSLIIQKGKEVDLDFNERCYGNFFCLEDQKHTRRDVEKDEVVVVDVETSYKGLMYWGETPLSFAACLNLGDAMKMLLQDAGADLYATDSNGNNILHMMVIHDNKDMFNVAYRYEKENPRKGKTLLEHRNRQNYTPLTLAAKMANKQMFDHILELKANINWSYGNVTCKDYPLSDLDSINSRDGSINRDSALHIVLSEESADHLDMLDGLLYQLLHDKWKSYAKIRFYQRFAAFALYAALFITAVYLHPGNPNIITSPALNYFGRSCYLPTFTNAEDYARTIIESIVFIWAGVFLYFSITEIRFQGLRLFLETLYDAPTKAGFLFSCLLVIIVLPLRMTCSLGAEDILISLSICCCIPYCLFFCRGFKLVGPFVVMIYNMIAGDLLRFLIIFLIFLVGFSQAMFVVFRGTESEFFSDQVQSAMGMFIMTMGEFQDTYNTFDSSRNPTIPKILFFFYIVFGSVLLLNMLIAMMGNTFNRIAQTEKEWQRQWAKIVLVIEQTVSPPKRKRKQRGYSQPYGHDGKDRALVIRARQKAASDKDIGIMSAYVRKIQGKANIAN